MQEFFGAVPERFEKVLLDSPPVLAVTDAGAVAAMIGGVIFVLGSGKIPQAAVRRAKEQVEAAQGKILGAVVNRFDARASQSYSRVYYQRYYGNWK
jgi:Mrp family chromosome partitioning ATPase